MTASLLWPHWRHHPVGVQIRMSDELCIAGWARVEVVLTLLVCGQNGLGSERCMTDGAHDGCSVGVIANARRCVPRWINVLVS